MIVTIQKIEISNLQDDHGPQDHPNTRPSYWTLWLPYLKSWSRSSPRVDINLDVGGTGRPSPLRTATVIELDPAAFSLRGPIAFTIQSQCDVRVIPYIQHFHRYHNPRISID